MTAALPQALTLRCNYCSKERPRFRVHQITQAQTICEDCLEWHEHAFDFLAGAPPRGCQQCERTWQQISDSTPGVQVRMYVLPKDGLLQMLCADCTRIYLPQRKDLFRGTRYGAEVLKT
jgi:hypothetical protein